MTETTHNADLQGVSETLLLPLFSRAAESRRTTPIVYDAKAMQLVDRIDYDFSRLTQQNLYNTVIALRTRKIDSLLQQALAQRPDSLVVTLGCGLDTRFERIHQDPASWLDIDFEEVIALRRQLLQEGPTRRFLAGSILDDSWIAEARTKSPEAVVFVAEGVLMYLKEHQVRSLISTLNHQFPGSQIILTALAPIEVLFSRLHPTVGPMGLRFQWGVSRGKQLTAWSPGVELVEEWHYCKQPNPRLGLFRLLRVLPPGLRPAKVLHYRLHGPGAADAALANNASTASVNLRPEQVNR